MIIIIGASGFIGGKIYEHFLKEGKEVVGTYSNTSVKGMVHFDLMTPKLKDIDIDLSKVTHAIICSAITDMDMCKKDKEITYKINVEGVEKLIKQLFENNIFPIFISSDYVFNGNKGDYSEEDPQNPNMMYGHYKMLVEHFLSGQNKKYLIARLGKVFGLTSGDGTLLTTWIEKLQNNETIKCATDQRFSPSYVKDVACALDISIQKELQSLYNIASQESFSRFELATLIKTELDIEKGEVIPCMLDDFNFFDKRPRNTTLNTDKFRDATNFEFTSIRECINILKKEY